MVIQYPFNRFGAVRKIVLGASAWLVWIIPAMFPSALVSCRHDLRPAPPETPSDHSRENAETKAVGEYLMSLLVDHEKGEIELLVTDAEERPVFLKERSIKGVIADSTGVSKVVRLKPSGGKKGHLVVRPVPHRSEGRARLQIRPKYVPNSAVYYYRDDWVTRAGDFTIEIDLRIKGDPYKAVFHVRASTEGDFQGDR